MSTKTMHSNRSLTLSVSALGLSVLLSAACADAPEDPSFEPENELAAQATTYGPEKATGTGCPAGTWSLQGNAKDGTLRYRFNAYQAQVAPPATNAITSCMLEFPSGYPANVRVAVKGFTAEVAPRLGAGTRARVAVAPSYVAGPLGSQRSLDLTGPTSTGVQKTWAIPEGERVYTPCGNQRNLTLLTNIRVTNESGGGTGGIRLTEIKYVELSVKPCS